MIHANDVAGSPEALGAWIARTDDIRATLTNAGYGTAFTADDLFPLFEGAVTRATAAAAPAPARAGGSKWFWIGVIVVGIVLAIAISVAS